MTTTFETQLLAPSARHRSTGTRGVNGHTSSALQSPSVKANGTGILSHDEAALRYRQERVDELAVGWYNKVLDNLRMRYRRIQRFAR